MISINSFISVIGKKEVGRSYVIGKKGTLCQTGIIQDEMECINAVTSFRNITIENGWMIEYGSWIENNGDYPKGCYIWEYITDKPSIYFNQANTGAKNSACRPVCRQGESQLGRLQHFSIEFDIPYYEL